MGREIYKLRKRVEELERENGLLKEEIKEKEQSEEKEESEKLRDYA